jgi:hypothetical protein
MAMRRRQRAGPGASGAVLLSVVLLMFAIGGSSASFIWLMNRLQTRAGERSRAMTAIALAEAGVYRTLSVLEAFTPGTSNPGRRWRPTAHTESVALGPLRGRFTVSVANDVDQAVLITSAGETGNVTRRLRARVYLATPAFLTALYAPGRVQVQGPPTALFILPYSAGIGDRPWVHMAIGSEVWFPRSDVRLNDRSAALDLSPGPLAALEGSPTRVWEDRSAPVRVALARGAEMTLGRAHVRVEAQQLRAVGVPIEQVRLRTFENLPPLPEVDRAYYQARATANVANTAINRAAGNYVGNGDLARKSDSLYSSVEFDQLQTYLAALAHAPRLQGVVYLQGALLLSEGQTLRVADGALVVEGAVYISRNATLEITHSATSRTLPGLIALDQSTLVVTERARLRVHGLLYVTKTMAIDDEAVVDVVGAVLTGDPDLGFRNSAGLAIIRYDPAVMGTPGLRIPPDVPVVAWVAAWEELP